MTTTATAAEQARAARDAAEDRFNADRSDANRAAAEEARRAWEAAEDAANAERRGSWS